jgi:hypothetical protein
MAYTQATPTITTRMTGSGLHYLVEYTETDVAAASEASVSGLPTHGRIVSYKATLTAGTGTSIAPEGGNAAGWTDSTQAEVMSGPTAAAHVHETQVIPYYSSDGILYFRATPDSATDNAVATEIMILEGWD